MNIVKGHRFKSNSLYVVLCRWAVWPQALSVTCLSNKIACGKYCGSSSQIITHVWKLNTHIPKSLERTTGCCFRLDVMPSYSTLLTDFNKNFSAKLTQWLNTSYRQTQNYFPDITDILYCRFPPSRSHFTSCVIRRYGTTSLFNLTAATSSFLFCISMITFVRVRMLLGTNITTTSTLLLFVQYWSMRLWYCATEVRAPNIKTLYILYDTKRAAPLINRLLHGSFLSWRSQVTETSTACSRPVQASQTSQPNSTSSACTWTAMKGICQRAILLGI